MIGKLFRKGLIHGKQPVIKIFVITVAVAMVLLLLPVNMLFADNTGEHGPSVVTGWTNPQNSMVSDNLYTTGPLVGLTATGYGFNIPEGSTINGIVVNVERKMTRTSSTYYIMDNMACLVINGTPNYNTNRAVAWTYWSLTEGIKTFGSPTDTWGMSLTPSDVNNLNFGFLLQPYKNGNATAYVDFIGMTVYYTPPDTTPPVINPPADIIAEATSSSGAVVTYNPTATDNVDPAVTVMCSPPSGSTFPLGTSTVTCNATDAAGNAAIPVNFNVTVQDTTAPVITITGDNPANVSYGDVYNEQGATWTDAVDGSGNAVVGGDTVNTSILGTYIVTYNYTDTAGNIAAEVTRTVNVVDVTKPVITLNGEATIYIENGEVYDEQGAVWNDNVDGTGTTIAGGDTVDTSTLGTYIVRYNYTDSSGNAADEVTRTVNVVDTQKPVITLLGDPEVTVEVFSLYSDAGATAYDSYEGDLTDEIITSNFVNTNVLGDYLVKYNVSDSSGNSADEVSRIVHVVDTTPPVISLIGINPENVYVWGIYNDDGATAWDNVDGNLTANIQTVNNVDTSIEGTYAVTYTVSDSSGNESTATRTVNVINHPPVARNDSFAFMNNGTINIPVKMLLSNDFDPEGEKISIISISQGSGGQATYSAFLKRVTFKPDKNFKGLASFSYTIQDLHGLQSSAIVWLSIGINELPDNLAPVVVDDTLSSNKVWTVIPISSLLANDSDPDGDVISFINAGSASNNARIVSLKMFGQLLLIVKRGYTGTVTFPYTIKDSVGLQSTGTVTINVTDARY